jgi:hypothetical protein
MINFRSRETTTPLVKGRALVMSGAMIPASSSAAIKQGGPCQATIRSRVRLLYVVWIFSTLQYSHSASAAQDAPLPAAPTAITIDSVKCGSDSTLRCKADDALTIRLAGAGSLKDVWKGAQVWVCMPGADDATRVCSSPLQPRVSTPAAGDPVEASVWMSPMFDLDSAAELSDFYKKLFSRDSAVVNVDLVIKLVSAPGVAPSTSALAKKPFALDLSTLYRDARRRPSIKVPSCGRASDRVKDCRVGSTLEIPVGSLKQWLSALDLKPQDLTLTLDAVPTDLKARLGDCRTSDTGNTPLECPLNFTLYRSFPANVEAKDNANSAAWIELFSRWDGEAKRVAVTLRHDSQVWPADTAETQFELHTRRCGTAPWLIGLGAALILIVIVIWQPGLIREPQYLINTVRVLAMDGNAPKFAAICLGSSTVAKANDPLERISPPLSLSRTVTLWWFSIVTGSLIYALCLTRTIEVLNDTLIALLGIPVFVAVGATLVDRSTPNDSTLDTSLANAIVNAGPGNDASVQQSYRAAVAAGLISKDIRSDLLAEQPDGTYDPHRIQLLLFSLLFGFIYVSKLNPLVALPYFPAPVLTLLGISSGTYLGFKVASK